MISRPARLLGLAPFAFALLVLSFVSAWAQGIDSKQITDQLKRWTSDLERVEKNLTREDLDDRTLGTLRRQLDAVSNGVDDFTGKLRDQLSAAQSQLQSLGPPPKEGEPPESGAAARERSTLNETVSQLDGAIRTAQVLQTRARQLATTIQERRRSLFSEQLLQRVQSPLAAGFWRQVQHNIYEGGLAARLVLNDWANAIRPGLLLGVLAGCALIWLVLWLVTQRLIASYRSTPDDEPPDYLRSAGSAAAVTLARALPPVAAAGAFYVALVSMDMAPGRPQELLFSAFRAFVVVAFLVALIRTVLAPNDTIWRILPVSDRDARLLLWFAAGGAVIYGLDLFLTDLNRIIVAPLSLTMAQKGIASVAIALLLMAMGTGIGVSDDQDPEARPSRLWRFIKLLLWLVAVAILVATAMGYIAFARFLVTQLVVTGSLLILIYLLHLAITAMTTDLASAQTGIGRWLPADPTRRDQTALLVSIVLNAVLFAAAVPLLLLQWGFDWEDVKSDLGNILFGFQFSGWNISLATILMALLLFVLGIIATRLVQHWLDAGLLRRTGLEQGARIAIGTGVGYLGMVLAALAAFAYTGLDFSNIAIVAGALSVGIGFGLQSIVNNFVSGLILLAERRISVGDWIVVGNDEGYVRRISVRATEIETFDRNYVIIPNSDLISNTVKNWTFRHRRARFIIPIGVSYESDPDQVRDILIACAEANEDVLDNPPPRVLFDDFGDNALMFRLMGYVGDVDKRLAVRSDMLFAILKAFREAGVEIPFPQRDLHLKDIDRLERVIAARRLQSTEMTPRAARKASAKPPQPAGKAEETGGH